MNFRVLVLACGLMLASACSSTPKCTPSTCSSGCCDASGSCQPGSSGAACGTLGGMCAMCALGQNCQFGVCASVSNGGGGGTGGSGGGTNGGGTATGGGGTNGGGGGTNGGGAATGGGTNGGGAASGGGVGGGAATGGGVGGGGATCSPANCAGCCNNNGICVQPPNNGNNTTCGAAGNACADCTLSASTCNNFTCGSTGGGTGGGGFGGGGGAPACTGCRLPSGTCVPPQTSGSNVNNCGLNGVACAACAFGELCMSGICMSPPMQKRVGDACFNDPECQSSLGALAICKQATTTGNGVYTGGYCTLRCPASTCPTGSTCVGLDPAYGEGDALCWDNCSGSDLCRANGYACYGLSSGSACWISPLPPTDAGPPADKVGNACVSAANCINPPTSGGTCLTTEFGLTWPGGYCSRSPCISNEACSSDGGAMCLNFSMTESACARRCLDSRDGGQSNCRSGYVCTQYLTVAPDGGQVPSFDGFCAPP